MEDARGRPEELICIKDRLDALEIRIAHQDHTIETLNETVTAQWRRIDALERELKMLREEVRNAHPQGDGPEPPPPHY